MKFLLGSQDDQGNFIPVTANTVGQPVKPAVNQSVNVQVTGDFGGGSAVIQTSTDQVNWATLQYNGAAYTLSDNSYLPGETSMTFNIVSTGGGQYFRAVLSGATNPSLLIVLHD